MSIDSPAPKKKSRKLNIFLKTLLDGIDQSLSCGSRISKRFFVTLNCQYILIPFTKAAVKPKDGSYKITRPLKGITSHP